MEVEEEVEVGMGLEVNLRVLHYTNKMQGEGEVVLEAKLRVFL